MKAQKPALEGGTRQLPCWLILCNRLSSNSSWLSWSSRSILTPSQQQHHSSSHHRGGSDSNSNHSNNSSSSSSYSTCTTSSQPGSNPVTHARDTNNNTAFISACHYTASKCHTHNRDDLLKQRPPRPNHAKRNSVEHRSGSLFSLLSRSSFASRLKPTAAQSQSQHRLLSTAHHTHSNSGRNTFSLSTSRLIACSQVDGCLQVSQPTLADSLSTAKQRRLLALLAHQTASSSISRDFVNGQSVLPMSCHLRQTAGPWSASQQRTVSGISCESSSIHTSKGSDTAHSASSVQSAVQGKPTTKDSMTKRKRILSGVQPTGRPTLGNYLGAIKNWVQLQDQYDNFFMVVDLHAITVPHDPVELRTATRNMAAIYLAAGIDPAKSRIFIQSHVRAHMEMAWLLNCVTPLCWLTRMSQYKDKAKQLGDEVRAGLLTYPVLMAADILLYQTDLVPVGDDQKQHLQLARDIAERVNAVYGNHKSKHKGLLKVPEAFIPPAGARIMSLQDGTVKMSKSAENDMSRINLTDTPDVIRQKIRRCKTDFTVGLCWDDPARPECANLLTIYQLCSGKSKEEVASEVESLRWGDFKPRLADAVIEHLRPVQAAYQQLITDPQHIDSILETGAAAAQEVANKTLEDCYHAMGFLRPARSR